MAKIFSHSKIGCFEQCPLKFKLKYIDRIEPDIEKTIEAHLGSVVHDTLEWLYKQVEKKEIPSIDKVIEYFSEKWEKDMTKGTEIIKPEMTEKDYFNKGVEFLISYYMKNQPFNDGTLECEKKVVLDLDDYGEYKIIGYIDRLAYNQETGQYEIHDYKTANNMPEKTSIENDRQLALYSIAIKELFDISDSNQISLIWHYLAHNQKIHSKRTDTEIENLKKETLEKIKEIEETQKTGEFPACPSILCNWCEFKNTCKEIQKAETYKKATQAVSEAVTYTSYFNYQNSCPKQDKQTQNHKTNSEELDIW